MSSLILITFTDFNIIRMDKFNLSNGLYAFKMFVNLASNMSMSVLLMSIDMTFKASKWCMCNGVVFCWEQFMIWGHAA